MTVAVYPGSFDPVTYGHIDIIERAAAIFDLLLVAVFHNTSKEPLFTMEERTQMLHEALKHLSNVKIESFSGLTSQYARKRGARVIIRGLRAISDFEYEFQMAQMNKKLAPELETLFMMTSTNYSYVSSRGVKEIAMFGGCVDDLVPANVARMLEKKLGRKG